jgi:hypothetical protein
MARHRRGLEPDTSCDHSENPRRLGLSQVKFTYFQSTANALEVSHLTTCVGFDLQESTLRHRVKIAYNRRDLEPRLREDTCIAMHHVQSLRVAECVLPVSHSTAQTLLDTFCT